jgi:hypothetical protein
MQLTLPAVRPPSYGREPGNDSGETTAALLGEIDDLLAELDRIPAASGRGRPRA